MTALHKRGCGCEQIAAPDVVATATDDRHAAGAALVTDETREMLERLCPGWRGMRILALTHEPGRLVLERFEQPYRVHEDHAAVFVETIDVPT